MQTDGPIKQHLIHSFHDRQVQSLRVNDARLFRKFSLNSESDEGDGGGHESSMAVKRHKSVRQRQWTRSPDLSDHPPPSSNDHSPAAFGSSPAAVSEFNDTHGELDMANDLEDNSGDEDLEEIKQIEAEIEQMETDPLDGAEEEAWEDELDENMSNPKVVPRPWDELRKKIKDDLKKNSKKLSLSQINQMLILANFATLWLKGITRIDASVEIARQWHEGRGVWFSQRVRDITRHYQIFEQLPKERRGGLCMARSWLHDEAVRSQVKSFPTNIPSGKVTPASLVKHVNGEVFPQLGIIPSKPLSVRTGRRWLIKLGWRYTAIKKGVYMDGHERKDVVLYRNKIFLPTMEKYEVRMVHYDGPDLKCVEPKLAEGEKEIIPLFHDECCFHANDHTSSAW
jgi:hypothetical protein